MASDEALQRLLDALDYPMYVVTTAADGDRAGCLVGFVTQCSIRPPRFLVCISKTNRTFRVACRARWMALHFLGHEEMALAERFGSQTGDDIDKFADGDWSPGPDGIPLLDACPNRVQGQVLGRMDAGDHVAFLVAEVRTVGGELRPLTFQRVRTLEPGHPA